MPDPLLVYWDSDVFLSYINGYPDRLPIIDAAFAEAENSKGGIVIITSEVTITEVAFALYEKRQAQLDQAMEEKLDEMWSDKSVVRPVEFFRAIGREARNLMRLGVGRGWSLKPLDAIHLATAKVNGCAQFHSYNAEDFDKYSGDVGFPIERPHTQGPVQLRATAMLEEGPISAASATEAGLPSESADADSEA